jgi:hypothetical protein
MKTSIRQALMLYDIAKWIDPYEICDLDKKDFVKSAVNYSLEANINDLNDYIARRYEIKDFLEDKILVKKYTKLLEQGEIKNGK